MANEKSMAVYLLQELEAYQVKQQDECDVVEELIAAYKKVGDKRNVVKTEDELEVVMKETHCDADTVKSYVSALIGKQKRQNAVDMDELPV